MANNNQNRGSQPDGQSGASSKNHWQKRDLMLQQMIDSAVLGGFSVLYACAVFLLKFRTRGPASRRHEVKSDEVGL